MCGSLEFICVYLCTYTWTCVGGRVCVCSCIYSSCSQSSVCSDPLMEALQWLTIHLNIQIKHFACFRLCCEARIWICAVYIYIFFIYLRDARCFFFSSFSSIRKSSNKCLKVDSKWERGGERSGTIKGMDDCNCNRTVSALLKTIETLKNVYEFYLKTEQKRC